MRASCRPRRLHLKSEDRLIACWWSAAACRAVCGPLVVMTLSAAKICNIEVCQTTDNTDPDSRAQRMDVSICLCSVNKSLACMLWGVPAVLKSDGSKS